MTFIRDNILLIIRIKQSIFLAVTILFTVSCTNIDKDKNILNQKDEPLIFIHGIKGGILADKDSKEIKWLNLSQSLNLSSSNLKLPLVLFRYNCLI